MYQVALSLTPQELEEIITAAPISDDIKKLLQEQVPMLVSMMQDGMENLLNPTKIWLESMQFADYVNQFGQHLLDCGAEDCTEGIGRALVEMAKSYKTMGERALTVIDEIEKEENGAQA